LKEAFHKCIDQPLAPQSVGFEFGTDIRITHLPNFVSTKFSVDRFILKLSKIGSDLLAIAYYSENELRPVGVNR
jgi:hypothetical protein